MVSAVAGAASARGRYRFQAVPETEKETEMMRAPGKIRFMNMRYTQKPERCVRKPLWLSGMLFMPVLLSAFFPVFIFVGCSKSADKEWKSPADDAALAKLEAATLERGIPRERRARLFFLWGQELASRSSGDPSKTDVRDQAIGAFERVVDLHSILVDESRFNLEILWRQKNRQNQQQNSQDKQDQQDQQKNGQNQQDKQNGKSENDKQSDQQKQDNRNGSRQKPQDAAGNKASDAGKKDNARKSEPKDLSAYVRDKEQRSELDKALKAELERRNEKQNSEAGGIVPVEKDW